MPRHVSVSNLLQISGVSITLPHRFRIVVHQMEEDTHLGGVLGICG